MVIIMILPSDGSLRSPRQNQDEAADSNTDAEINVNTDVNDDVVMLLMRVGKLIIVVGGDVDVILGT